MPRAPKPCGSAHCEALVRGRPYCDEHASRWRKRPEQDRPDTGRADHRRVREQVLARDGRRCQLRLAGCLGTADQLDHIVPKSQGGKTTVGNGVAACSRCHQKRSASQGGQASAAARRAGVEEDPAVRRAMEQKRQQRKDPPSQEWSPSAAVIRPRW
jgi:5-methylcytosine-specific restriction enzyme A